SRDGDGKYPGAGRIAQARAVEMDLAIPERLKVPATQALVLRAHATGVQIYECDARNDDPTRFEWIFKATRAELLNRAGERIGQHSAGPAWESTDGSKVVAEVTALHPGPDPNAIPWMLLSARSNSGNLFGVFGGTQSIQRVRTTGGKAPTQMCNRGHAGKRLRQPFEATYYFYGRWRQIRVSNEHRTHDAPSLPHADG